MPIEDLSGVAALERQFARKHLEGDNTERVDVGTCINLFRRHDLFRSHVVERSHRAGLGDACRTAADDLGNPEVHQHRAALPVFGRLQHDIRRLHVTVDEALDVCVVERGGDIMQDRIRLCGRHRAAGFQFVAQLAPFKELHHHVEHTLVFAEVKDVDNVRVLEGGDDLRLTLEAGAGFLFLCQFARQHFDSDGAIQRHMFTAIDLTHAAAT